MWLVKDRDGQLIPVHNRATAEQLAIEYGTQYVDAYSGRSFTPRRVA